MAIYWGNSNMLAVFNSKNQKLFPALVVYRITPDLYTGKEMQENDFETMITTRAYALKPYAMSLTKNLHDAQDLVQETIYRAIAHKDKFVADTNLKAWLYTIMKNLFINNYRRKIKRNTFIDQTENMFFINSAGVLIGNDGELELALENINQAISSLSEEYRVPFLMHYKGYKYLEIADHLEIPMGTVKSRIHFARKMLQGKLKRD